MPLTSTGRSGCCSSTGRYCGAAVDLTRAREDDLDLRVVRAARLENRELAAAVDLEIGVRVAHRVEVARLAGQVEEVVLPSDEMAEAVLVADVRDVHRDVVLDAGDVEAALPPYSWISESTSVTSAPELDELARARSSR